MQTLQGRGVWNMGDSTDDIQVLLIFVHLYAQQSHGSTVYCVRLPAYK